MRGAWEMNAKLIATSLAVLALHCSVSAVRVGTPLSKLNATCVLVFGDSTVDSGNNNYLATTIKANFPPYGRDFFGRRPTGRFSNGRLATDFIVEALGLSSSVPAFLDPSLKPEQLLHGDLCFASAASGYDDLTDISSNVLPLSKQIDYLKHYKIHLRKLVGANKADQIVADAIFVLSAGTNDFVANYFVKSNRSNQFTVHQYEDYLITRVRKYINDMHKLGGKRFVLVGVPPMGCLPLVRTLKASERCFDEYNEAAISFNSKLVAVMSNIKKLWGVKMAYVDVYGALTEAMSNPNKYGFTETSKGCVGSGLTEFGEACKGLNTCKDPSSYIFWDAVHPTESMYKIIADEGIKSVGKELMS